MSDLILTGWSGVEFANIAAHTLPVLASYAKRHGLAFGCANLAGPRPPSWMKVPSLALALEEFDRVAWIDADVVVLDGERNIFDAMGHEWHGLVEHETNCGLVPNCGVWVLTQAMLPVLHGIWDASADIDHPWWEQASVLRRMGYLVSDSPHATLDTPTTLYGNTAFLDPTWNHHPADVRRVNTPRFVHVTQYDDRLATVRDYAAMARP